MSFVDPFTTEHMDTLLVQDKFEEFNVIIATKFPVPQDGIRIGIFADDFTVVNDLLSKIIERNSNIKYVKAILWALRNGVAYNEAAQTQLAQHPSILNHIYALWSKIEGCPRTMNVCVQLCVNMVCFKNVGVLKVWGIFHNKIIDLLGDHRNIETTSAFIFYALLRFPNEVASMDLLNVVLKGGQKYKMQNFYASLEILLIKQDLIQNYRNIDKQYFKLIFSVIDTAIKSHEANKQLNEGQIVFLCELFKDRLKMISKLIYGDGDELNAVLCTSEIVYLIDIFVHLTSEDDSLRIVQEDADLMVDVSYLLKYNHDAGKIFGHDAYKPMSKLTDLSKNELLNIEDRNRGLKSKMIRIIGNMCNKHEVNQNKVRGLDCIPLILDCCNIDFKNPLILQCSIFALRLICEKNVENQNIIRSMTKQGVINSETLLEMGIALDKSALCSNVK